MNRENTKMYPKYPNIVNNKKEQFGTLALVVPDEQRRIIRTKNQKKEEPRFKIPMYNGNEIYKPGLKYIIRT